MAREKARARNGQLRRLGKAITSVYVCSRFTNSNSYLKSFAAAYKDMVPSQKWMLSSPSSERGSAVHVEDVLFENFKSTLTECTAHSWVLDMQDTNVRKCFGDSWDEVSAELPSLPKVEPKFALWLATFAVRIVSVLCLTLTHCVV